MARTPRKPSSLPHKNWGHKKLLRYICTERYYHPQLDSIEHLLLFAEEERVFTDDQKLAIRKAEALRQKRIANMAKARAARNVRKESRMRVVAAMRLARKK